VPILQIHKISLSLLRISSIKYRNSKGEAVHFNKNYLSEETIGASKLTIIHQIVNNLI